MIQLKIQHSILLKPKKNQTILNVTKLQQSLTKFPSWFLITYNYQDKTKKSQIIHLDNPIKNLKKQVINNKPFFKGLAQEFYDNDCKDIHILICKNK